MKKILAMPLAVALALTLSATTAQGQDNGVSIPSSAVAMSVVDREPADAGSSFSRDVGQLYAWTRVAGAENGERIHHVWIMGDTEMADVELTVGGPSWRTWSSKNIQTDWLGDWRVEVRDDGGNVLDTMTFRIER